MQIPAKCGILKVLEVDNDSSCSTRKPDNDEIAEIFGIEV